MSNAAQINEARVKGFIDAFNNIKSQKHYGSAAYCAELDALEEGINEAFPSLASMPQAIIDILNRIKVLTAGLDLKKEQNEKDYAPVGIHTRYSNLAHRVLCVYWQRHCSDVKAAAGVKGLIENDTIAELNNIFLKIEEISCNCSQDEKLALNSIQFDIRYGIRVISLIGEMLTARYEYSINKIEEAEFRAKINGGAKEASAISKDCQGLMNLGRSKLWYGGISELLKEIFKFNDLLESQIKILEEEYRKSLRSSYTAIIEGIEANGGRQSGLPLAPVCAAAPLVSPSPPASVVEASQLPRMELVAVA
ncbi:MAG: hypothetical protein M1561_04440 [Gammaproteobacteria bacterium]|nr:hypothetical protein [Gammaproteobacteria bacterium]